jgi:hypothetical protein
MWMRQDRFQASPSVSTTMRTDREQTRQESTGAGVGFSAGRAYLRGMAKSVKELPRWRVTVIKGKGAIEIGTVRAVDAEKAIKTAIKEYEITDVEWQRRLAARPLA